MSDTMSDQTSDTTSDKTSDTLSDQSVQTKPSISEEARALMQPDNKIGVLATCDADGMPHLALITSLQALGSNQMSFGKFAAGISKGYVVERPDVAFLVLNASMQWVAGNMRFSHTLNTGPLFEEYNSKPLFRYNAYLGFSQIFVLDLIRISEIQKLPMPAIVLGALLTRLLGGPAKKSDQGLLSRFSLELFNKLDNLKFVSWFGEDGLLKIMPIIQAAAAGSDRVIFSGTPYGKELAIPRGAKTAILCLNLQMQSVLIEGTHTKQGAVHVLEIERVYNSMPPKAEYLHPRPKRPQPITEF